MPTKIKKMLKKSLKIESILEGPENEIPSSNDKNKNEKPNSKKSHLEEFKKQCSNLCIFPINIRENYSGNYSIYIEKTLTHISELQNIKFEYALEDPKINEGVPTLSFDKKILFLDLDETLIHADFEEKFKNKKYDKIIKFNSHLDEEDKNFFENNENDSTMSVSEEDDNMISVGIFVRNGVYEFLKEVNKYFDVGIFTASVKEYADAVISFLDPDKKLFKYKLYRNNCINFNDSFMIKDLRIFKNVDLKKIILLDNSIYSFATQINNGILINSFFDDKNDIELKNALEYLINFIAPADDVRNVNEHFFNFNQILKDIKKCK